MSTKKVTKKEYFTSIISLLNGALDFGFDPDVDVDAVIAFCESEIATLDRRAAKAKETAAAKKESDPLYDAVAAALTADFASIDDITAAVDFDDPDLSRAKVSNRLTKLAKNGLAEKGEIVSAASGKSKRVVAYRAAATE